MVVLHIASINDNHGSGVCVVVPQHVSSQQSFATVGLLNINNVKFDIIDNMFLFHKNFEIEDLPEPFKKPDIVIFHEVYRVEYLKISARIRKQGIPYIIIPHGELRWEAQKKRHYKKVLANFFMFKQFINGARAIQCLTQKELDNTHFGEKKFVGTNGISIPEKHKISFRSRNISFTYIGRLEAHVKGLDLMLEAVRKVEDELRKNKIVFNMYGPDYRGRYANIEHLILENGIGDIVTLHPAVFGDEKEKILLDTDIFIQTSRHEGMPMGILEAMSYGIPCLVTEGTAIADIVSVNKAGWVCQTDADSIADSMKKAIEESKFYMEYSNNAINAIKNKFLWENVAFETIEKYDELLTRF